MTHVRWKFKDVGPDFATPEGMVATQQARMRTIMGLAEDHPVILLDAPKQEPKKQEDDGLNITNDSAGDSDSDAVKLKTVRKRSKRSKPKS